MRIVHNVLGFVVPGGALPGRVQSQQGEDERGAGHDAESAERHAEVSPPDHHPLKLY